MGFLHEIADRRMALAGGAGLIASLACGIAAETASGRALGLTAAALQVVYVALYARYSKPINTLLIAGALRGEPAAGAHALQRRWDRVVYARFALMGTVMLCLTVLDR